MKARLTCGVLMALAATCACAQQLRMYDDRPKITVRGEAAVNVKPDRIVISFGIETSDTDISVAKEKNNVILKNTLAAAKECGVPEKDVQTAHISIEPRWDGYKKFLGYFVRNTIVVTLTEIDKVEPLVTSALKSGVNYIHGIDFQTTQLKTYREQARELALRAAKEKASKMSAVLGQTVGEPIRIDEGYNRSPWGYWSSWDSWRRSSRGSQVQVQADRGGTGDIVDTVALGKLSITATVSVTFRLKE